MVKKTCILRCIMGLLITILLGGCAGTSTLYANTFAKPAQPLTDLKVLYLENKLITKIGEKSESLAAIGYNDLPELFRERVPVVLGMNGISAEYASIPRVDFGRRQAIEAVRWSMGRENSALLVIQVVDGSMITSRGNTTYYLNMHANLYDMSSSVRKWTGQFKNTLGGSILYRVKFDNEFVDEALKTVLEQMANDGFVKLKEGKALIPKNKASASEQKDT